MSSFFQDYRGVKIFVSRERLYYCIINPLGLTLENSNYPNLLEAIDEQIINVNDVFWHIKYLINFYSKLLQFYRKNIIFVV